MPRHKKPPSLQDCCVAAAGNLLYALNDRTGTEASAWPKNETSPFLCCPNKILQKIISYLGRFTRGNARRVIHKHVMQMLLCRNLSYLDLSPVRIHENELADVLKMILPSASRLHTLQLFADSFATDTKESFLEMLQRTNVESAITSLTRRLENVTRLHLHNLCDDNLLRVIGQNCHQLVWLRVISENISDSGLNWLCTNGKSPLAEDFKPQCQKLQQISLDPRAEGVTSTGIRTLLTFLPELRHLEGCAIGHVIEEIYDINDNSLNELNLTHYMYDWRKSQNESLDVVHLALKMCPHITTLMLLEPSNEALATFGALKHLMIVTVISYNNQTSFESGILSLLQQAGSNVEELSLSLRRVDLSAIDWCCPKIKRLDCSNVLEIITANPFSVSPFRLLADLIIHANLRTTLTADTLKIILSHCFNLESLYITYCDGLTDALLDEILQFNPLRKLKYLHLMYVERLSIIGIESLVIRESDLERLWLFNRSGNHKVTLRKVKELVKELNLDLKVNDDFH